MRHPGATAIQKQIIANKEETIRKIKGTFEGPHHDKNKYGEML